MTNRGKRKKKEKRRRNRVEGGERFLGWIFLKDCEVDVDL